MTIKVPLHQWTHNGNKVLLVRCCDKDGEGYGGFQWPKSGRVICPKAEIDRATAATLTGDAYANCRSGGLFGWAWAINIGGGKEPDYRIPWIVFAANPSDVVDLGDKQKVVGPVEVVYYGDALGAIMYTFSGRQAFVIQNSNGSASNSGYCGSASNSGYRGSASNSGDCGSASNSGCGGSASLTGELGTIDVSGDFALGCVTAKEWFWVVRPGSVIAWRWGQDFGFLLGDKVDAAAGTMLHIVAGKIQEV